MRFRAFHLERDQRGATLIEFAVVLPVLLVTILGLGDLSFQGYVQSVLTGAVQKAGRDSTVQGADAQSTVIDNKVKSAVMAIVPGATFGSTRVNFDNYRSIAGEPFVDTKYPANATGVYDGICNHNETYTDVNANGRYDSDLSASGQGGAGDVTRYTVTITYPRLFPIASLIGWGRTVTASATTLLKNQPYATQVVNKGTATGTCP